MLELSINDFCKDALNNKNRKSGLFNKLIKKAKIISGVI